MNGLIGNNKIYKKNKEINYLWVKAMEEIQYFWNDFSDKEKLRIKKLLYLNYDFMKKNIDRQIKKNIKKIYLFLEKFEKQTNIE